MTIKNQLYMPARRSAYGPAVITASPAISPCPRYRATWGAPSTPSRIPRLSPRPPPIRRTGHPHAHPAPRSPTRSTRLAATLEAVPRTPLPTLSRASLMERLASIPGATPSIGLPPLGRHSRRAPPPVTPSPPPRAPREPLPPPPPTPMDWEPTGRATSPLKPPVDLLPLPRPRQAQKAKVTKRKGTRVPRVFKPFVVYRDPVPAAAPVVPESKPDPVPSLPSPPRTLAFSSSPSPPSSPLSSLSLGPSTPCPKPTRRGSPSPSWSVANAEQHGIRLASVRRLRDESRRYGTKLDLADLAWIYN